jgi:hypothetical protein
MPTDLSGDYDPQDQAEVFDEDNVSLDGAGDIDAEMRTFEEMEDVFDVTSAVGDADNEAGLIGEDLDDAEIIDLEADADMADYEDDELAARMPEELDDDSLGIEDIEEVAYDGETNLEGRLDTGLNLAGDEYDDEDEALEDEAGLQFTDDTDGAQGRGTAARLESTRELSNEDLEELGYRDEDGPK